MSSVIGGMEDTIAQTMAQIGWPGAEQVQPEEDNAPEIEAAPEPVADDEAEAEAALAGAAD